MELMASESSAELRLSMQHVSIHYLGQNSSTTPLLDLGNIWTEIKPYYILDVIGQSLLAATENFVVTFQGWSLAFDKVSEVDLFVTPCV